MFCFIKLFIIKTSIKSYCKTLKCEWWYVRTTQYFPTNDVFNAMNHLTLAKPWVLLLQVVKFCLHLVITFARCQWIRCGMFIGVSLSEPLTSESPTHFSCNGPCANNYGKLTSTSIFVSCSWPYHGEIAASVIALPYLFHVIDHATMK